MALAARQLEEGGADFFCLLPDLDLEASAILGFYAEVGFPTEVNQNGHLMALAALCGLNWSTELILRTSLNSNRGRDP